jgi:hypothetical protein
MLRINLLLTTAFVVATALSSVAAPSIAVAQPAAAASGRDSNSEFLHNYGCAEGAYVVDAFWSSYSGWLTSYWEHVAVPIIGRGQTVHEIVVKEGYRVSSQFPNDNNFSIGIYTNSVKGFPGQLLAGGSGVARRADCGPVTISIPATKLSRRKKYWIEETTIAGHRDYSSSLNDVIWDLAPNSKPKAYKQNGYFDYHSGYTSSITPWTQLPGKPYFRLK